MNSKEICLKLLASESEKEVQKIIDSVPEMYDPANWSPIDDRESNFNVVTNQASTGGKAATELRTNMVDAILMRHAREQGINSKDRKQAPANMYDAVDRLVENLRGGKLVNANEVWLRDFASKNLIIGITGSFETTRKGKEWPCYTFVDNGEGQHPVEFKNTFLSLSARNKSDIPFVQGKYNMGSSGVLSYCGNQWFKLIVSRRYDASGPWGWTVIRRRPGGGGIPIADYFQVGDKIPVFDSAALYPLHKNTGCFYDDVMLKTGTVVKLYDFRVGEKFKDFRGAREAFNENLTETILPFRIMDFRWKTNPKKSGTRAHNIVARPFYGMEYMLRRREIDGGNQTSEKFQVGAIDDPKLGRIEITAIPLRNRSDGKDPMPSWLKPHNSNSRVFHAVNGQVQFKQTRGYLSTCGYSVIKDRAVIIVDASRLTEETHFDLWKGDRENIRQNTTGEQYLETVKELIKGSPSLDGWKQEVAREDLKRIATDDTNDLFQKLVNSDRDLAALLDQKDPTIKLPDTKKDKGKKFEGNYNPTFLTLDKRFINEPLELPINKDKPFQGKTDAVNDFFIRDDSCGQLFISDETIRQRFSIRQILHNGQLTVFFRPSDDTLQAGDYFSFELGLYSDSMPKPITQPVSLKLLDPEPNKEPGKKRPKPTKLLKDEPKRGLPKYVLLTQDGRKVLGQPSQTWPAGFSKLDGGRVKEGTNGLIYEINVDNAHHIRYRQRAKSEEAKDRLSHKYITAMRLFMLCFENSRQSFEAKFGKDGLADVIDDFRQIAADGSASVVLWLTDHLPKIIDLPDETVE